MSIYRIALVLGLAVLAAAGWRFGQSATFQRWTAGDAPAPAPFAFDNGSARVTNPELESTSVSAPRAHNGVHKCARGTQVVYTDGKCPPGSKELDLTQGTVTVMPGSGQRPPTAANQEAEPARRKNIRDVMLPPEETSMKDRRMEQVIGK
jgi:hypothetical protein